MVLSSVGRHMLRCRRLVGTVAFLISLLVVSKEAVAQPREGRKVGVLSNDILSIAYSPDGKQIAGGSFNATIKIWNANNGKLIRSLIGHKLTVRAVAFAPRGSVLASGSDDKTTILWDAKTGKRLRTLDGFERPIHVLKFSSDGNTLWIGSRDLIAWDEKSPLFRLATYFSVRLTSPPMGQLWLRHR